jgi:predicted RecB family endonuclease
MKQVSVSEKITQLADKYGSQHLANALGVSLRTIDNYKDGGAVKQKEVINSIDAFFSKMQNGAERLINENSGDDAGVLEAYKNQIEVYERQVNDLIEDKRVLRSQAAEQKEIRERLVKLEEMLTRIEGKLLEFLDRPERNTPDALETGVPVDSRRVQKPRK